MARRFALVFAIICAAAAAGACSVFTSWDDVTLGSLAADASARDADRRDTGSGIGDGGPIVVDAGVDANCSPDVAHCTCTPGTSMCVPGTSTSGSGVLYACTDAGIYSDPVTCDDGCAMGPAGSIDGAQGCNCTLNRTYCGGHDVVGSPSDLYECGPNGMTFKETCPFGQMCRTGAIGDQCAL